jgi:LysR family transcriptional regulator, regulator of abg operon
VNKFTIRGRDSFTTQKSSEDVRCSKLMHALHHGEMRTMRLQAIQQFIAVVDAGSIRGAARQLNMSQPTLTRSLQQLEEDLGVQLMLRSGRGASLTDAGTMFLARARVAESELRKAAEEARRALDDGNRVLSIGLSPVGASLFLPELVNTLQRERPKTRIRILEMTPSTLLPLVRDEVMDLAITQRSRIKLDAGLTYKALAEIPMHIAVRPGHPLLQIRKPRLHDLVSTSWLYMTAHDSNDDIVSRSFLEIGLPIPVPMLHCGSYFVALDLLSMTDMVGVLPPTLLRNCINKNQLAEIVLEKPLIPIQLGLYTRAGSPPTSSAKLAAQTIVAIAKRITTSGELRNTYPLSTIEQRVPVLHRTVSTKK